MENTNSQNLLFEPLRSDFLEVVKVKGLSQDDIAKALGISQGHVSLFLNGKRQLGGEATLRLQKFMCEVQAQLKEAEKSA